MVNIFLIKKCTNKDIRQVFNEQKRVTPRGKFYWNSILRDVNWRKAWLLPYKFCISNKVREIHLKILHKIYPTNMWLSNFMDIGKECSFCNNCEESLNHLFVDCQSVKSFWKDCFFTFSVKINLKITLNVKEIICYFENDDKNIHNFVNFIILNGKFFIHKCRLSKSPPLYKVFSNELTLLMKSLKIVKNSKAMSIVKYYEFAFGVL